MSPSLRKAVAAAIGGGAVAIASVLITGPGGNDGLEGVSYIPYKDIVGVWTVCHGHTGKDIMPGKTYTEAECKALLNNYRMDFSGFVMLVMGFNGAKADAVKEAYINAFNWMSAELRKYSESYEAERNAVMLNRPGNPGD